jgi:hypothetical protein
MVIKNHQQLFVSGIQKIVDGFVFKNKTVCSSDASDILDYSDVPDFPDYSDASDSPGTPSVRSATASPILAARIDRKYEITNVSSQPPKKTPSHSAILLSRGIASL